MLDLFLKSFALKFFQPVAEKIIFDAIRQTVEDEQRRRAKGESGHNVPSADLTETNFGHNEKG